MEETPRADTPSVGETLPNPFAKAAVLDARSLRGLARPTPARSASVEDRED
ncbi:hypothetical protein [Nocardiopsis sp. FIRDI 009]|uniref:hypothetical protein n=1 Tax=Nocardiopsis sp. FIRDI 009 TaxID=714197 RepID=UPI001E434B08|nr:hypothetical protein [Nocardiopsis sp. FIRDI 009]